MADVDSQRYHTSPAKKNIHEWIWQTNPKKWWNGFPGIRDVYLDPFKDGGHFRASIRRNFGPISIRLTPQPSKAWRHFEDQNTTTKYRFKQTLPLEGPMILRGDYKDLGFQVIPSRKPT